MTGMGAIVSGRRWYARCMAGLALLIVGGVLGGCQTAAQNTALSDSSMKMEDPQFYPSDNGLRQGKIYFQNGQYGLAEASFRKAVEAEPKDTEAWIGLAASLDQLRRFDLADKAYGHVLVLGKNNVIVLNNAGYSNLLRGNVPLARKFLLRAYELEPDNPYVLNNLQLLGESGKTIKRAAL